MLSKHPVMSPSSIHLEISSYQISPDLKQADVRDENLIISLLHFLDFVIKRRQTKIIHVKGNNLEHNAVGLLYEFHSHMFDFAVQTSSFRDLFFRCWLYDSLLRGELFHLIT